MRPPSRTYGVDLCILSLFKSIHIFFGALPSVQVHFVPKDRRSEEWGAAILQSKDVYTFKKLRTSALNKEGKPRPLAFSECAVFSGPKKNQNFIEKKRGIP
jgi:hypothetical protein